ncbi:MAG: methyltransferase domain-containing protein [Saprospiraceae bacterium]|nr:methyltransferase domain-containing protein [Saprospiraceae bacterium]
MTDLQKSIISYYDNTWFDYRVLWLNKRDRAVHFGYYETFTETHSEALKKLNLILAQKVNIMAADHVLDAGCGQGGSTFWIAENIGARVTGITLVPHQVEIARREAESRALTSLVDFSIQDYTQTIFDDASFDVVWACESLCHAGRKKDFYREAYRLLKPGGRLVIAEYIRRGRNLAVEDEAILQTWCSGWSMPDLDTWDEHWSSMQEAGFTDIDPKDVTAHVSPSLNKLFKMSKSLLGLGKFLHFTKIRNDVMHGNQVASVAQFEALSRNLWYYCIYSATKPTVPL